MPERQTAPYGSWSSPITSDLIVSSTIGLSGILLDGTDVYWLEARPQENGRSVIVRRAADGSSGDVTPPVARAGELTFNVRTRVHEYGGGSYLVSDGVVYFCNDADQRLYRQELGGTPVAITPDPARPRGLRYADGVMDAGRGRMIWVREDHTAAAPEPVNTLVEIPLDGSRPQRVLQSGRDFYAAPRLSPDGSRLAWLEWSHPNMPWIGCELWVGECAADGSVGNKRLVAGGDDELIFQPEWSPDGTLYFVSDRAQSSLEGRWWNLFRVRGDALDNSVRDRAGLPAGGGIRQSSVAVPHVHLRVHFGEPARLQLCARRGSPDEHRRPRLARGPPHFDRLRGHLLRPRDRGPGLLRWRFADHADRPIVELHLPSGRATILKLSTTQDVEAYRKYLSVPEPVTFDTDNGLQAYGLFYPPQNADFAAPAGELPPLLVHCHGGPTAAASPTLSWGTQYWTSRGFAVLDVNYGGSTGYGREYRLRLQGNWGVVDVADCVNGARHLAETGRVDPERWAISGASAGGYTTLAALTFRKEFKTGASYYGISDLEALAKDTHKFESRYLDGLIGPHPQRRDLYVARSPIHSARLLAAPVAFFQGAEDTGRPAATGRRDGRCASPAADPVSLSVVRRRAARVPPRRQHQAGARC